MVSLVVSFMVQDGEVDNPDLLNLDLTEKGPNATGSIHKRWTTSCRCLGKCPYGVQVKNNGLMARRMEMESLV